VSPDAARIVHGGLARSGRCPGRAVGGLPREVDPLRYWMNESRLTSPSLRLVSGHAASSRMSEPCLASCASTAPPGAATTSRCRWIRRRHGPSSMTCAGICYTRASPSSWQTAAGTSASRPAAGTSSRTIAVGFTPRAPESAASTRRMQAAIIPATTGGSSPSRAPRSSTSTYAPASRNIGKQVILGYRVHPRRSIKSGKSVNHMITRRIVIHIFPTIPPERGRAGGR
jgi:hypothetical protein